MKTKIRLTVLALFIASFSFAQLENLTLTDIITFDSADYLNSSNTITVPNGKMWVLNSNWIESLRVSVKLNPTSNFTSLYLLMFTSSESIKSDKGVFLTQEMEFYFILDTGPVQFLEYDVPSTFDGTLAINEQSFKKENLMLFPNPTDSKLN